MQIEVTFTIKYRETNPDLRLWWVAIGNNKGQCLLSGHMNEQELEAFKKTLGPCKASDISFEEETCK